MLFNKREALEAALDQPAGRVGSARVILVTEHADVDVPECMKSHVVNGLLTLRYSWRFRTYMEITYKGVSASLSYGGTSYNTFVPWGAVVCVIEDATEGQCLWPYTGEAEVFVTEAERKNTKLMQGKTAGSVQAKGASAHGTQKGVAHSAQKVAPRAGLRVIQGGLASNDETPEQEPEAPDAQSAALAGAQPTDKPAGAQRPFLRSVSAPDPTSDEDDGPAAA